MVGQSKPKQAPPRPHYVDRGGKQGPSGSDNAAFTCQDARNSKSNSAPSTRRNVNHPEGTPPDLEADEESESSTKQLHDPTRQGLGVVQFDDLLREIRDVLGSANELEKFTAYVNLDSVGEKDGGIGDVARVMAARISEVLHYRFKYHSKYYAKKKMTTRIMFHCCQSDVRQQKSQKREGVKNRDKGQMETFPCHGWMHITMAEDLPYVLLKLSHGMRHKPYWDRQVPDDVRKLIRDSPQLTTQQLWDAVLQLHPVPKFTRKTVAEMWRAQASTQWTRHSEDQVESARELLAEASCRSDQDQKKGLYQVEPVVLPAEKGFTAVAFTLPALLRKYGGKIREIQVDSTFQTNKSNFEVYAVLGEVYGSGCPLAYLLVQPDPGMDDKAKAGGKQRYITALLKHLRDKWEVRPITTLTDKDWSEINSCLETYPDAKHQLCFWHALRALKTRLSTLRRKPNYYDVNEARKEYTFVKADFLPDGQVECPDELYKKYPVAQDLIPHMKIRLGGTLSGQVSTGDKGSSHRRVTFTLNGKIKGVVHIPEHLDTGESLIDEPEIDADSDTAIPPPSQGDFEDQVDSFIDDADEDQEDGPDWLYEEGEVVAKSAKYTFCLAVHRRQVLKLFTSHFCQHPLFYERLETKKWSAEQIRDNAVKEAYQFCETRGLREVWGYLWANWYSPSRWNLWARSTSPHLSRLRTTMGVENFWRQLKHDFLHNTPRPRVDQLIWILINKVTPVYYARLASLSSTWASGLAKPLTTFQRYFKRSWKVLATRAIRGSSYVVDIETWSCNCGQQKYDPFHLCKHLVQAVETPLPIRFWQEVRRRRTSPLYIHPCLKNETTVRGSITDGDDRTSESDDSDAEAEVQSTLLGASHLRKRAHSEMEESKDRGSAPESAQQDRGNAIDLTVSSSPPRASTPDNDGAIYISSSPSRFYLSDPEDEVVDEAVKHALSLASKLDEAAEILREQARKRNGRWLEEEWEDQGNDLGEGQGAGREKKGDDGDVLRGTPSPKALASYRLLHQRTAFNLYSSTQIFSFSSSALLLHVSDQQTCKLEQSNQFFALPACQPSDDATSLTSVDRSRHGVSKLEAHLYYHGICGRSKPAPKLIFRTSTDTFLPPSGPSQDLREMQLLSVHRHHQLGRGTTWQIIRDKTAEHLDRKRIRYTSIDLVRFRWEEQTEDGHRKVVTSPATIWIGVLPDSTNGDAAFDATQGVLGFLEQHSITNIDIAYRESVARFLSGPTLYAPVSDLHPLKSVIDPVTTSLSLPIAGLRPDGKVNGGALGFYFRVGGDLYGVTARHVLFLPEDGNEPYRYDTPNPKKNVVLMGQPAFADYLASVEARANTVKNTITVLRKKVNVSTDQAKGADEQSQEDLTTYFRHLREAESELAALLQFWGLVKKDWSAAENRVIGHVVWAPPITSLNPPHGYTCDVCVIKLEKDKFLPNLRGNAIDLGTEIEGGRFMTLLNPTHSPSSHFDYPADRLYQLRTVLDNTQIREEPNTKDIGGEPTRFVIKRGPASLTTVGRLNGFDSRIRRYDLLGNFDSVEAAVYPYDSRSGPFSRSGDSGAAIVGAKNDLVVQLTGGTGTTDSSDMAYGTPIEWLWNDVIKVEFPDAELFFADN